MTSAAVGFRTKSQRNTGLLRGVSDAEKAGSGATETPLAAALDAIVAYIPTEVVTTYVAILAAINTGAESRAGQWAAFWAFATVTPVSVWLIFATKLRAAGKPLPVAPKQWPLWEMFAASVAFAAWGYALPDSPFNDFDWYTPAVATVVILGLTFLLGLVAPLFQPKTPTS